MRWILTSTTILRSRRWGRRAPVVGGPTVYLRAQHGGYRWQTDGLCLRGQTDKIKTHSKTLANCFCRPPQSLSLIIIFFPSPPLSLCVSYPSPAISERSAICINPPLSLRAFEPWRRLAWSCWCGYGRQCYLDDEPEELKHLEVIVCGGWLLASAVSVSP